FDVVPPRQHLGADAYRKAWVGFFATFRGTPKIAIRTIATSQYGGINGNAGSNQINSFYPITRVLTPEYVDSVMRHQVAKDGSATYTTSGPFVSDMIDIREDHICF